MHIEPGVVNGAKLLLSVATATGVAGLVARLSAKALKGQGGLVVFVMRSLIATLLTFCFFEVLPTRSVGVSEVHFIFATPLFLLFGVAPAALGLALGLLAQGLFFAPGDLPQYGMNVTTLLIPLFAVAHLAGRIIPAGTAYKDISYKQALTLSTLYQAGIVSWVSFWAFYGSGVSMATLTSVASFGAAYMTVIIVEPLVELAIMALARHLSSGLLRRLYHHRVYQAG